MGIVVRTRNRLLQNRHWTQKPSLQSFAPSFAFRAILHSSHTVGVSSGFVKRPESIGAEERASIYSWRLNPKDPFKFSHSQHSMVPFSALLIYVRAVVGGLSYHCWHARIACCAQVVLLIVIQAQPVLLPPFGSQPILLALGKVPGHCLHPSHREHWARSYF